MLIHTHAAHASRRSSSPPCLLVPFPARSRPPSHCTELSAFLSGPSSSRIIIFLFLFFLDFFPPSSIALLSSLPFPFPSHLLFSLLPSFPPSLPHTLLHIMSLDAESSQPILQSYVGFDSITSQIEKKLLKRGFQFNVMVVGQSGLGKSTLVNTIFASHLIDSKGRTQPDEPTRQTVEIHSFTETVVENGVKLKLNIVDTPGYGDQVNNENCWEPIIKYIKDQHSSFLRKELTAMRDRFIQDTRIHCCLFFISPTGHSLKPIDIVVLKKLTEVVNVVPVIAKSDSLTIEERIAFKHRIKEEMAFHNINLYPYGSDEDDEQDNALNESIQDLIPFAVVGSEKTIVVDGKTVRGRQNRWGVINVENENHCEFIHLRNFLTRTHLQDLIETTAMIHYESFRSKQLLALKESGSQQQQQQQH